MNALALVIGNANYTQEKDRLINAVNDADDIVKKLLNLGFTVSKSIDCSRETFDREIRRFGNDLKKYDIGLFYFSGHGLQIKGQNYLTAIDTSFADDISATHTSLHLDEVIDYMKAANPIINILILDACRDNPLPSQFRGVLPHGLAPIYAPKGTIIAFSTSPGEKAMDFGAGRNSIYTGSLLNHIDDLNVSIEDFFKRVRTSVYTLSNGKQTSWEHTSLIGNFCFNSGQLVHSVDLPYKEEHIVDEDFESDGSEIQEIIKNLKSYDWYTQQPAIQKISRIDRNSVDESSRFLLGRNILQVAAGGEFSATSIMKNLGEWLKKWDSGNENHILNGILFEIYFNSKGLFRNNKFKCSFIDEIYSLESIERFKKSFEFIRNQIAPFEEFIFYMPFYPPATLPIELIFEEVKYYVGEEEKTAHQIISIKLHNSEIMMPIAGNDFDSISVRYDQFIKKLQIELCIPIKRLKLSMNVNEKDLKIVYMPWELKLSKNINKTIVNS